MFNLQEKTKRTQFIWIAKGSREQIMIIRYKDSSGVRICIFIIGEKKELAKLEDTKKMNRYRCIANVFTLKIGRALLINTRPEQ